MPKSASRNITGLAVDVTPDIAGKRLALLKEAVPTVSRVAVLWEPALSASPAYWQAAQRAAVALRLGLRSFELRHARDLDAALDRIAREGTDALLVFSSPPIFRRAADITAFARQHRLPAVFGARAFAEGGGLLAYGTRVTKAARRLAAYVDRIVKGAQPADLPFEVVVRPELIVNLKTAQKIGVTIPPEVLKRADRVIQ